MSTETFHRRPLPGDLIAFASSEGRAIFREALAQGGMEGYFPLAEQFHTQSDPAFCGLGTLVLVLNALAIDPERVWKGPWRWYSEELLDCCLPPERVAREGITMSQFACLARCNGASVTTYRADRTTLEEFRSWIDASSRAPDEPHLVASYSRRALGQTGTGHYSPIAGYHAGRDLALVLDVARFKYPPHWVPVPALWGALGPPDPVTGAPRGYMLVRRGGAMRSAYCRVQADVGSWRAVAEELRAALPGLLEGRAPESIEDVVEVLFQNLSPAMASLLAARPAGPDGAADAARTAALLGDLRATEIGAAVRCVLEGNAWEAGSATGRFMERHEHPSELATMLLLAVSSEVGERLPEPLRARLLALGDPAALPATVREELAFVRQQMSALHELCCR
jgi:glutathione gamma-glutamylcysteinyltransferase